MWLRVGLQGSGRFELKDEWDSDGLRHFWWRFQSEQRQGSKKESGISRENQQASYRRIES